MTAIAELKQILKDEGKYVESIKIHDWVKRNLKQFSAQHIYCDYDRREAVHHRLKLQFGDSLVENGYAKITETEDPQLGKVARIEIIALL